MGAPVKRWRFVDLDWQPGDLYDQEWVLPINPLGMAPLPRLKQFRHARTTLGRTRSMETPLAAQEWSFEGYIRSQEHHEMLADWARRQHRVKVYDHRDHGYELDAFGAPDLSKPIPLTVCVFIELTVVDRRPTPAIPWRQRYTMSALVLRSPSHA